TTISEIVVCGELSYYLARYKSDLCEKVAKLYPSFVSEDPTEYLHTSVLEKYAVSAGAAMYIFEDLLLKD
ncbi:MAG: hypothetical protein MJ135_05910, partial [Oscillospiraceae bacterium]|nr:hypothetical protein [Oscillospiraceae bacterium]